MGAKKAVVQSQGIVDVRKKDYLVDLAVSATTNILTVKTNKNNGRKDLIHKLEYITVKEKGSEGKSCGSEEETITWKINN